MKRTLSILVPLILFTIFSLAFTFNLSQKKKEPQENLVRKAAVAGGFYPEGKAPLEKYVDDLLRQANPPEIKEPILALMVPHAGYVFSGSVAASAYKEIEGRDIRTVILLGNSHTEGFDGISVYKEGSFETPLGRVKIDATLAQKIIASDPKIVERPSAHERDHILEVQLPFLQRALKDFKIVPIVFGSDSPELTEILARAIKENVDDKTLVVASTDMSHYPSYENATVVDRVTLQAITTGRAEVLDATLRQLALKGVANAQTFLCGHSAVRTILLLAQTLGPTTPVFLKYANSGDISGDKTRVVGYGAIAFVVTQNKPPLTTPPATEKKISSEEDVLNSQEKTELLGIARTAVESYVRTGKVPELSSASPGLQQPFGTFVTLKKSGQLRGCIGRFEASEPLYKVVAVMAVSAATQDPRFSPIRENELGQLDYEISVLSPLRKIAGTEEIVLGKHGVAISKGSHHGVFLPQVATETGWGKEEFLSELCSQKAGLARDCWKDPEVTFQVFTAEIVAGER